MEGFEMRPLSLDLRERIVAAYEANEGSHATLGRRFSVSARVVGKLVQQHRELGTLEPQMHHRGRKPAIAADDLEALKRHVKDYPDATGEERREALKLNCTTRTVYKTLHRLGQSFKKRHHVRQNKIELMS
jgi:transposase